MKIENAKIRSVTLSMADHASLTFFIYLDFEGSACGFGGYAIGHGYLGGDTFIAESGDGLEAMMQIMNVVGVERWEDLKGQFVRCKSNDDGTVDEIGNIIENKWFNIKKFFETKSKLQKDKAIICGKDTCVHNRCRVCTNPNGICVDTLGPNFMPVCSSCEEYDSDEDK